MSLHRARAVRAVLAGALAAGTLDILLCVGLPIALAVRHYRDRA